MRRSSSLLAAIAVAALAFAPSLADARAGGGGSMGSRGGRTFSAPSSTNTAPSTASPMERTMTQRPAAGAPGAAQSAASRPGFGGFGAGLMGGLLGVGLGGLLFGSGMFGGMSGLIGLLGFALQAALIFFAVRWLVRRFMGNRQPALAGAPGMFARNADVPAQGSRMLPGGGIAQPAATSSSSAAAAPVAVVEADYQSFDRLLHSVQAAWTARDTGALRAMSTPEMAGYFDEQLAAQSARGVRNEVTDVKLEQGDLSEAWREGNHEYATVAMRFSMLDVTRDAAGRVVEGDPDRRAMATELWTFVRGSGRPWTLSAIQQTR